MSIRNALFSTTLLACFGLLSAAGCGEEAASGVGEACNDDTDCRGSLVCISGTCARDSDDDGVPDGEDNCPETPNPDQTDTDDDGDGDACDDDRDDDGIPDDRDNCPETFNPEQTDSDDDGTGDRCDPDQDGDGDGVPDDEDNCPNVPNNNQTDTDGDGQGDACDDDADGDGIPDDQDNCPLTPNPNQDDRDDDKTGDACDDSDGDGVVDLDDNCPETANPNQADLDGDGTGDACDPDQDGDGIEEDGDGSGTEGDNPCDGTNTSMCDDNCPRTPNPNQADEDRDGEGDACDPDQTRRSGRPYDKSCTYEYRRPGGTFTPSLEWKLGIPNSAPYPQSRQVMMTPSVVNLDDDNGDGSIDKKDTPEVIYATFETNSNPNGEDDLKAGVLRVAAGDGSGLEWSAGSAEIGSHPDAPSDNLGVQPAGSVATGDLDGDNRVEIVAGALFGGLIAFEHDGTVKWMTTATDAEGNRVPHQFKFWWGGPAIADLDEDGHPEIISGGAVFDHTGTLQWNAAAKSNLNRVGEGINWAAGDSSNDWYTGTLSAVADLDGQGDQEVVTGITAYRSDGTILWKASDTWAGSEPLPDGFPALGDVDGDGAPEVVVSADGTVRVHDGATGRVVWGPVDIIRGRNSNGDPIPGGRIGPPTVADFDGDNTPEVGVAGESQYVALEVDLSQPNVDYEDAKMWKQTTQDESSNMTGSSVFDFEGDGRAEVVYNDELKLRVYDGKTGDVLFEQSNTSFTALEYPIIVDIDGDGAAEIVVSTNNFECGDVLSGCNGSQFAGLKVFSDANDNWVATRRIWNQHTYHIDNVNSDGTIPATESPSWGSHNTYRLNRLTQVPPRAAPNLEPESPTVEGSGCSVTARTWVTNSGAVRVGGGIYASAYAVNGDTWTFLGSAQTRLPLDPGESERVDIPVTVPSSGGPWDLKVVVDDNDGTGRGGDTGAENECDESDNEMMVTPQYSCSN